MLTIRAPPTLAQQFSTTIILTGKQQSGVLTCWAVLRRFQTARHNSNIQISISRVILITCVLRNTARDQWRLTLSWQQKWSSNRRIQLFVSLKTKFKRHLPGKFHDCSWVFRSRHCSRKGARRAEERRKKERKRRWRNSIFTGSRFITLAMC